MNEFIWRSVPLGEVLPLKYGKNLPAMKRTRSGEYNVVSSAGIVDTHCEAVTSGPAIVIGRKGTVGSLTYCKEPVWPTDTAFYTLGTDDCGVQFGYYLLQLLPLSHMNNDSAVPGLNRNDAESLIVHLPPVSVQQDIVSVLGTLDDKIAANQKVIKKTLELTFCLSSRRDGVEAKLEDIAEFISRGVVPKYTEGPGKLIINQRCIRGGLVDRSQARWTSILPKDSVRLVHQYDVLINSTGQGTLGRMAPWIRKTESDNEVVTDTHITTVRFNPEKVSPAFAAVVLASRESAMASLAEGSTGQTELKRELVRNFRMNLPPLEVQNEISSAFHSLFAIVVAMEDENEVLIRTRDELLPLLMRGKVSVRDAEEAVVEVGVEKREDQDNVQ